MNITKTDTRKTEQREREKCIWKTKPVAHLCTTVVINLYFSFKSSTIGTRVPQRRFREKQL
jgi:hypothetical protein